jgi:hypothetical protein
MQPTTKKDQSPVKDAVHNVTDRAKDAASNVADKARDAAHNIADSARDAANQAGQGISGAASTVGKKAEQWTANAGHGAESLADTLRDKGPSSGMLGRANEAVADCLENTGEYLADKNLSGMMGDVTNLIKRNPIPALLVGLGIGYLLGKSLRS